MRDKQRELHSGNYSLRMEKESLIHRCQLLEYENGKLNSRIGEQKSKIETFAIKHADMIFANKELNAIYE